MQNKVTALKIVYEHVRMNEIKDDDLTPLRNWANHKSNRGYTAMHFAAFHGNIEMIKYLEEEMEADVKCVNNIGINVLHCAA